MSSGATMLLEMGRVDLPVEDGDREGGQAVGCLVVSNIYCAQGHLLQ